MYAHFFLLNTYATSGFTSFSVTSIYVCTNCMVTKFGFRNELRTHTLTMKRVRLVELCLKVGSSSTSNKLKNLLIWRSGNEISNIFRCVYLLSLYTIR
jgi:hypothetical protein